MNLHVTQAVDNIEHLLLLVPLYTFQVEEGVGHGAALSLIAEPVLGEIVQGRVTTSESRG